jgi:hypothetical protein
VHTPRLALSGVAATVALGGALVLPASAQESTPSPGIVVDQPSYTSSSPAPPATPSPSPSPCAASTASGWVVSSDRLAPGDEVHVTGGERWPCAGETSHEYLLRVRVAGEAGFRELERSTGPTFSFLVRPQQTSTYEVLMDGQRLQGYDARRGSYLERTVVVDRSAGSCAGVVQLSGPGSVAIGQSVQLVGRTSGPGPVSVLFRRRGEAAFQVRRSVQPDADGRFRAGYVARDDYRVYASTERCDSAPLLVAVRPVVEGPPTARRDSLVTLTVRTLPGQPVRLAFRRAGERAFVVRRSGTSSASGTWTTTYRADADHRYYAVTGPGTRTSSSGLTQVA